MKEFAASTISAISCDKEFAKTGWWCRVPRSLLLHKLPQVHLQVSLFRMATADMEKIAGRFVPAASLLKKLAPLENIFHVTHGSIVCKKIL